MTKKKNLTRSHKNRILGGVLAVLQNTLVGM